MRLRQREGCRVPVQDRTVRHPGSVPESTTIGDAVNSPTTKSGGNFATATVAVPDGTHNGSFRPRLAGLRPPMTPMHVDGPSPSLSLVAQTS